MLGKILSFLGVKWVKTMKKKLNNFPCSTLSCEGYHCFMKMQIDVGKKCLIFVYQFKRNQEDIYHSRT